MSGATAAVAAAIAASRRRVVEMFREGGALTPDYSMTFHPIRPLDQRTFQRLLAQGVIKPGGSDTFYLDEAALAVSNQRRRSRVLIALAAVTVATAVVLWITFRPR